MSSDVPEIGWTSTIFLLSDLRGKVSLISALRPGSCFVSDASVLLSSKFSLREGNSFYFVNYLAIRAISISNVLSRLIGA